MPIEFRPSKPPGPPIKFADTVVIPDTIVRTSDLPQGIDTAPLAPFDPKDGRGFLSHANILVDTKQIYLWPARTGGNPQSGIELKYGRFVNGLPATITHNSQLVEGSFYPLFVSSKQKIVFDS